MPTVLYDTRKGKRREYQNQPVQPHFFLVTAEQSGHKIKGEIMKRFNLMLIMLLLAFLTSACNGISFQVQVDESAVSISIFEPASTTTGVVEPPLWKPGPDEQPVPVNPFDVPDNVYPGMLGDDPLECCA